MNSIWTFVVWQRDVCDTLESLYRFVNIISFRLVFLSHLEASVCLFRSDHFCIPIPVRKGSPRSEEIEVQKWTSLVANMATQHGHCSRQASLFMSLQGYFRYHRFLLCARNMRGYFPCRCKTMTASIYTLGSGGTLFLLGRHENLVCICVSVWRGRLVR